MLLHERARTGKLYSYANQGGSIVKMNLDGSSQENLFSGPAWGGAIALDLDAGGLLHWAHPASPKAQCLCMPYSSHTHILIYPAPLCWSCSVRACATTHLLHNLAGLRRGSGCAHDPKTHAAHAHTEHECRQAAPTHIARSIAQRVLLQAARWQRCCIPAASMLVGGRRQTELIAVISTTLVPAWCVDMVC